MNFQRSLLVNKWHFDRAKRSEILKLTCPHADAHATHGDDTGDAERSAALRAHQAVLGTLAAPQAAVRTRIGTLALRVAFIHVACLLLPYNIRVAPLHIILLHG